MKRLRRVLSHMLIVFMTVSQLGAAIPAYAAADDGADPVITDQTGTEVTSETETADETELSTEETSSAAEDGEKTNDTDVSSEDADVNETESVTETDEAAENELLAAKEGELKEEETFEEPVLTTIEEAEGFEAELLGAKLHTTKQSSNTWYGYENLLNPSWGDGDWTYVYFGKYNMYKDFTGDEDYYAVKYRVLDNACTDFNSESDPDRETILLDSEDILTDLEYDDISKSNISYAHSVLRNWLNSDEILNNDNSFTGIERNIIVNNYKAEPSSTDGYGIEDEDGDDVYPFVELKGDKIFALDMREATNEAYGFADVTLENEKTHIKKKWGRDYQWWTRSGYYNFEKFPRAEYVSADGKLSKNGSLVDAKMGVSPTLNIDPSRIMLTTLVRGEAGEPGAAYKLTLESKTLSVEKDGDVKRQGNVLTIPYSTSGQVNQVSVLVGDLSEDNPYAEYCGKLEGYEEGVGKGKGSFTLPEDFVEGADHIYLIPEHLCEKDYFVYSYLFTDFAGDPVEIEVPERPVTPLDISDYPTPKTDLKYNGEMLPLLEKPGSADNGIMEYRIGSGSYEREIPKRKNAGTYTVYYRAVPTDSENYTASSVSSIDVTIAAKELDSCDVKKLDTEEFKVGILTEDSYFRPTITIKDGETLLKEGVDYAHKPSSQKESQNFGTYIIKLEGKGNYKGDLYISWKVTQLPDEGEGEFKHSAVEDQLFTGVAIKPEPVIKWNGKILVKDEDYTLSYKNNINAASKDSKKAPTIVVKGMGKFTKTVNIPFTILPRSLAKGYNFAKGFEAELYDVPYTGKTAKAKPVIKYNAADGTQITLKETKDYTLTYNPAAPKEAGDVMVTITGKGNYKDSVQTRYRIMAKGSDSKFSKVVIEDIPNQYYDPSRAANYGVTPGIVVYQSKTDKTVVDPSLYSVIYTNNTKVGKATVKIQGIDGYAEIKASKTFKILARPAEGNVEAEPENPDITYTGKAQKPKLIIKDKATGAEIAASNYTVTYSNNTAAADKGATKVVKGKTVSAAPTYTIKFKGNYSGTVTGEFKIAPLDLNTNPDFTASIADVKYNGTAPTSETLKTVVKFGKKTMKKGTDYTVSYTFDSSGEMQKADIILCGNYSGTRTEVSFRVYKANLNVDLTSENYQIGIEWTGHPLVYNGFEQKPPVYVMTKVNGNDIYLVQDRDYTVTYKNNTNAGEGSSSNKKAPTATVTGKGIYKGKVSRTFDIEKQVLSTDYFDLTAGEVKANKGKAVNPKTTVKYKDENSAKTPILKEGKDYKLNCINNTAAREKYYTNPPTVTIEGIGNYKTPDDEDKQLKDTFRIYEYDISTATVEGISKKYTYTGSQIKPAEGSKFSIYADKKKKTPLAKGVDFAVIEAGPDENINIGKGSVTIEGRGKYGGTKTIKFSIVPKWFSWLP